MKLEQIAQYLVASAITEHCDQVQHLEHGARLAVRVADGWAAVRISRAGAPVGRVEESIFRRAFAMPDSAQRSPATPEQHTIEHDGSIWCSIVYRYELAAVLPADEVAQVEQPPLFDMEGNNNATQANAARGIAGR